MAILPEQYLKVVSSPEGGAFIQQINLIHFYLQDCMNVKLVNCKNSCMKIITFVLSDPGFRADDLSGLPRG